MMRASPKYAYTAKERYMNMRCVVLCVCVVAVFLAGGCAQSSQQAEELKRFPIDSLDGIITQTGAELDKDNSSDGKGSLRIVATGPTVVRLFEVSDVVVENARLTYRAKIRSSNLEGQAYLEMWCSFPGKGEFFSRGLQSPVTGSTGWVTTETPFLLKKGEKPDVIKLNIVINGKGTVWIDDVRLWKGPLQ
jgi:hypothetical protein